MPVGLAHPPLGEEGSPVWGEGGGRLVNCTLASGEPFTCQERGLDDGVVGYIERSWHILAQYPVSSTLQRIVRAVPDQEIAEVLRAIFRSGDHCSSGLWFGLAKLVALGAAGVRPECVAHRTESGTVHTSPSRRQTSTFVTSK